MDWKHFAEQLLQQALPYLITLASAGFVNYVAPKVPGVTQHFFDWLKSHTAGIKNQYAREVLNRLISLMGIKVLAIENTEIEYLKEQVAAGKITKDQLPELLKGVKQKALDQVKDDATAQGLWKDAIAVFGGSDSSLLSWLGSVLESHVAQLPASGLRTDKKDGTPAATTLAPKNTVVTPSVPQ